MINQSELKTLVPSLVMSGVLLYEAITGNAVSEHVSNELANGILIGAGYMVTLWGIWKNHQKVTVKSDVTPPKIPPDVRSAGLVAEQPKNEMPVTIDSNKPIVTQSDLNKKIQG